LFGLVIRLIQAFDTDDSANQVDARIWRSPWQTSKPVV